MITQNILQLDKKSGKFLVIKMIRKKNMDAFGSKQT